MTKPITDARLAKIDAGTIEPATGITSAYVGLTYAEYSGIRARLRLAEAVVEAAAADLKCSRDAFRDVLGDSDAKWLAGCPESERRLIDALTAYRKACGGKG